MNSPTNPARGALPHLSADEVWLSLRDEEVLDPELSIVDAHHHLWDRGQNSLYMLPQLLSDITSSGHSVRGTVFMECASMYRVDGEPRFACLGQVEFVNGVAAIGASGLHGDLRVCAGIVGKVDLTEGASIAEVLQACIARAPDRFKGIRHMAAWDASSELGQSPQPAPPNLLEGRRFREGFAQLAPLGLSFDAWVYHTQLHQIISLADAFPETTIVLNHMGGRVGIGPYALRREEVFTEWRAQIEEVARRPNVILKIGGIGMRLGGFGFHDRPMPPSSADLTLAWRPAFDVCLAEFGPQRAMFESNFPIDKTSCSYRVIWNTFKRLSAGYSQSEREHLFARTAIRAYRLPPSLAKPAIKDELHF